MKNLVNFCTILISTLDCNQNCNFCLRQKLNQKYNLDLRPMSVETAQKIIEQHPESKYVVVTGGEPLLNLELLDYLFSTDKFIKILTNGTIELPDKLLEKLSDRVTFSISINDENFPPLYNQLTSVGFQNIIVRTFLSDDYDTIKKIINKVALDPVRGYELLIDNWIEASQENEDKIKEAATIFATYLRYEKDLGMIWYFTSDSEPMTISTKYAPNGQRTKSLYGVYLPESVEQQIIKKSYVDTNIFKKGRKTFQKGMSAFKVPKEYYTCLYYEEMKKAYPCFDPKKFL